MQYAIQKGVYDICVCGGDIIPILFEIEKNSQVDTTIVRNKITEKFEWWKKNEKDDYKSWFNDKDVDDIFKYYKDIMHKNDWIYEDGNNKWSIELVGSSSFDEKDEDWACDEVFSTRDNPFVIIKESNWENIEKIFTDMVKKYLDTSKNANKLKQYMAIGIGFVDGNLNVIYKN